MNRRKLIYLGFVVVALAAVVFSVAACSEFAPPPGRVFEKPKWNLVFESKDFPSEKNFTARYCVKFVDSAWKKDDPDNIRVFGTVELDMDGFQLHNGTPLRRDFWITDGIHFGKPHAVE